MTASPDRRHFLQRVRRIVETARLAAVLASLIDADRDPDGAAPPREAISALDPTLTEAEVADVEWLFGIVRAAETLEGLGMLRGLMGGGNTRLLKREPVDVIPFVHHHVRDLLTFRAALASCVGVTAGEDLRAKLVGEIDKAIAPTTGGAFSEKFDAEIQRVIEMDLGREARTARHEEMQRKLAQHRADMGPSADGSHRVLGYRPNPYVQRIDTLLDVLGVPHEGRDQALDAAQQVFESTDGLRS